SISIHESGNWGGKGGRDVQNNWNSGGNLESTNTFDRPTKPGAYYQITVTWENGETKTVDRQMPESGDLHEVIYQSW
ncbi:MAG: hypothetical protein AB1758_33965, partial [Candidatus Eremiobacterota bacterium]